MLVAATKLFAVKKAAPAGAAAHALFHIFSKAAALDTEARETLGKSSLNPDAFQISTTLRKYIMAQPTRYGLNRGPFATLKMIISLKPIDLANDLQLFQYL